MNENSTVASLKFAKIQHEKTQAALEKIQLVVTGQTLPVISRDALNQAHLHLADVIALRLVGEGNNADEDQARAKLQTAEREFVLLEAEHLSANLVFSGLNRLLLTAEQSNESAALAAADAEKAWISDEMLIADAAYAESAAETNRLYKRVEACIHAMSKRGGKDTSHFSYSDDLNIPVIGPASATASEEINSHKRSSSDRKNIYVACRRMSAHQTISNDVENELLALLKNSTSVMDRIIKKVGL